MAKRKATTPPASPKLRLEWIDVDTLDGNPLNWKTHPEEQIAALRGALAEVDWAGALLYNERTRRLIDGHARKEMLAGTGQAVPVLIGDWTEEQEKKILATLDPLAGLAQANEQALAALVADVHSDNPALQAVLDGLVPATPEDLAGDVDQAAGEDVVPDKFQILIECADEGEQLRLLKRFEKEKLSCRALTL